MEQIGSYINIREKDFYFSGCHSCDKRCCDGRAGYSLTPLVVEDFMEVYKHFPILFGSVNGVFRPLMVLNDGDSACSYLDENGSCSIYEERPPACRLYPLSPFFDEVFIDAACPSVSGDAVGVSIVEKGNVCKEFYHKRLENFAQKLENTSTFMEELVADENDFELVGEVSGVALYKYSGKIENEMIQMHRESLRHLE